jgi:hypothetical protein
MLKIEEQRNGEIKTKEQRKRGRERLRYYGAHTQRERESGGEI